MIHVTRLQVKFGTEAVPQRQVGPVLVERVAVGVLGVGKVEEDLILYRTEKTLRETCLPIERQQPLRK